MPTILIHIANEDPVVGEVEAIPSTQDTMVIVKNPRRRDGKDLTYLEANVTTVIWPVQRVNFIEVIPSAEEDDIISFVRD